MLSIISFLVIITLHDHFTDSTTTEMTISVDQRIELLKREIMEEINDQANLPRANLDDHDYSDQYQYVDLSKQPLTPIQETDKRKEKERYKLPEIISRPTEKYVPSEESDDSKPLRSKKHHVYKKIGKLPKPKDIFYRRMYMDDDERNKPQKWTHCLNLVTPFLNGIKENMTSKLITPDHDTVRRLAHLLSINVTDQGNDEIRSVLYQISNIQMRLFTWDVNSVKIILNIIIGQRSHDFRGLKFGLKYIFNTWQLDTSDISSFVRQSRIFRPPCVQVSEFDGSTLTSKSVRYTKAKTKKCPDEQEESECSA